MKKVLLKLNDFLLYLRKTRIDAYSAQIGFFTIMSFIPLLVLFFTITNNIPVIKDVYREILEDYIPDNIMPAVSSVLEEAFGQTKAAVSISVIFTAWIAGKSVHSLTNGLNSIYGYEVTKPWIVLRGKAVINTVLYILIVIVLIFVLVFGGRFQEFLVRYIPQIELINVVTSNRYLIALLFIMVTCLSFYVYLPQHKTTILKQLPGALFSSLGALVVTFGLNIYVNTFNGFSMYGSLTSLVLIMMWLYILMYTILLGAALNHYIFEPFIDKRKRKKT